MRVVWSHEAEQNLLAIATHIAQDAPARAQAYVSKIESKTTLLEKFPNLGRIVPELQDQPYPPRELLVDDYRILYGIQRKTILIFTVFHGRKQFPLAWQEPSVNPTHPKYL